ncbi:hypothetical protein BT96DRAFT_833303 [Gymnopus androsaceus JB14]|uniref:Uncharacterized protein n=1 Tax=Gymnopus androsaceus JB14 TaxID=1447944 RepID=A0A6A4GZK6_9AGAR|nr:hypothetical protein BT96DRAFT_833303 [Gymnopus androsaceus JB14]
MFWESPRFSRFQKVAKGDATATARKFRKLTKGLRKPHTSILVHLCTGHCYLYSHLNCIGKIDTPLYPACKQEPEMVHHYLIQCPAHCGARARLRAEVGSKNMFPEKLLNDRGRLKALFQYINNTGRFINTFGVLPEMETEEEEEE